MFDRKSSIVSLSLVFYVALFFAGSARAVTCLGEYSADDSTLRLWHFNDGSGTTALDDTGSGYDGKLQGTPLPTWATGRFGGGLHLTRAGSNGVNLDYFVPNDKPYLTESVTNFTLEMNFKWDYAYVSFLGYLFSLSDTAFARIQLVEHGLAPATYQIEYSARRDDGAWPSIFTPADSTLDTNWHHLAFTRSWDGVNTGYKVYVDGVEKASGSYAQGFWDSHIESYIGSAGSSNSVGGAIDEVRFSNFVRTSFQNDWGHRKGDINQDCYVDFEDVAEFAADWLK